VLRGKRGGSGRWTSPLCLVAGVAVLIGTFVPIDSGASPWSAASGSGGAHAPVSASSVQADLSTLEQVYDDVVPALQNAGAAGHQVIDPEAAVQLLASDPRTRALSRFVTNFSALYGIGVLLTQRAASSAADPAAYQAMQWLAWVGLLSALASLLVGVAASRGRRHPLSPPGSSASSGEALSSELAGIGQ
jgi:hypothetical protein